jgi:hypothetical protein
LVDTLTILVTLKEQLKAAKQNKKCIAIVDKGLNYLNYFDCLFSVKQNKNLKTFGKNKELTCYVVFE